MIFPFCQPSSYWGNPMTMGFPPFFQELLLWGESHEFFRTMTGRVQFNIHSKIMTSINQGTQNIPKWMVYNGKSYENLMIWGYPHEKNIKHQRNHGGCREFPHFMKGPWPSDHPGSVIHHGLPVTGGSLWPGLSSSQRNAKRFPRTSRWFLGVGGFSGNPMVEWLNFC